MILFLSICVNNYMNQLICKKDKLIIHGAGHTESRYKEPDIYYNKIFDFIKIVMKEV